ncbi:DMT family transporter [Oxalobacteraceae bacterium A2-2]
MWHGVLCGLGAGALWGMVFILPQWLAAFSPMELAVGRYLVYGLITLVLLAPRWPALMARLGGADYAALLRHALAGNVVYYVLLSLGVQLAGVAATSLIIGLLPLCVTVLGRREHGAPPLRILAWPLALVAAGMACMNLDLFLHARSADVPLPRMALGVLCACGALACWSWYAVDNARYLKRNPHFSSAEWSGLYGVASGLVALLLGAALLYSRGQAPAAMQGVRDWSRYWMLVSLVALGASVIGNQLWNVASRSVPVTLAGQLILFETLFALLYGYLRQQHGPRPLEALAIALLVAGVAWSVRAHAGHAGQPA